MEVLTLQTPVYYPDGSINITNTSILPRWKCEHYNTRVYYPDGSVNVTNTSICTQMDVLTLQTLYIAQTEVLTLQTRVYYPD